MSTHTVIRVIKDARSVSLYTFVINNVFWTKKEKHNNTKTKNQT